jgi:hypothetical protein
MFSFPVAAAACLPAMQLYSLSLIHENAFILILMLILLYNRGLLSYSLSNEVNRHTQSWMDVQKWMVDHVDEEKQNKLFCKT